MPALLSCLGKAQLCTKPVVYTPCLPRQCRNVMNTDSFGGHFGRSSSSLDAAAGSVALLASSSPSKEQSLSSPMLGLKIVQEF